MRILHLIHTTHVGGVETAAALLREQLGPAAVDHELDGPGGRRWGGYRVAAFAAAPPNQAALDADVTGAGLNAPATWRRLITLIRASAPDVLVTSLWRSTAVGALALAGRGPRRPDRRISWAIWVHNTRFTQPLDRLVHRWALRRADLILCDSEAVRDQLVLPLLRGRAGAPATVVVRPEAATLAITPRPAPRAEEPLELIFWGRIAPQKRLDRALDLLAELRAARPAGARLVLVGPDGGDLARLRRLITERGLTDHVEIHDAAGRDQLSHLAAAAHVFVQLSAFEGYGMSAHEALRAGMVCVLTPVGDLATDTADGVSALHHRGDAADTASRLLALAADAAAWQQLGAAARSVGSGSMLADFTAAATAAVTTAAGREPRQEAV